MTEQRFEDEIEEPGDPLKDEEEPKDQDKPDEGEPWAKTSSGDADEI